MYRTSMMLSAAIVAAASLAVSVSAADTTELRMTALAGPGGQGVQAAIALWNKAHPEIQVKVELQADETNWQATAPTTMFAASDGPDLSWWWCSRSFQYKDMVAANLLAPLDDLYKSEGWDKAYPEGTLTFFTEADGHRYGVNSDVVWTPYVYYNKDIFKKVGVEIPKTWDEFKDVAKKIRAAGYQPMVTVYDFGMVNHLPDGIMMRAWTKDEYNAYLTNWSPKASPEAVSHKWTDPDGVKMFQMLKDVATGGIAADGFAGLTDSEAAKSLFTSGKAAMYQSGSWDGGASGLAASAKFDFGYFYYPAQANAYGPVGSWIPNCFIAFNRKNQEAAKKVVAFLASKDGLTTYAKAARSDVLNPMTLQMMQDVKDQGAPPLYESSVPPDILRTLKQASDLVLTGAKTPEEAAKMMQDAYEKARKG